MTDLSTVVTSKSPLNQGNFHTPNNSDFYSKFHYAKLDPNTQSIRLLRIHPPKELENTTERLECLLLEQHSLDTIQNRYKTLSYCAGDPRSTEVVIINDLPFNVFANLGHALRQARHLWRGRDHGSDLLLWVDQVCINQNDHVERSEQVRLMGDIYAKSQQVFISLSDEMSVTGGIGWIYRLLSDYNIEIVSDSRVSAIFDLDVTRNEGFKQAVDAFIETILESPWWSRAC